MDETRAQPEATPPTAPEPSTAAPNITTPFSLPTGLLIARGVAPAVAVGALAVIVAGLLRPGSGWMSATLGSLSAVIGILAGVLVIAPWKARPVTIWPALLLGGQGAGFVAALVSGLLLYSASRPGEPLIFGAALAVGLTAGLLSVASLFGRIVANRGP